jgi:hypothetical protein
LLARLARNERDVDAMEPLRRLHADIDDGSEVADLRAIRTLLATR